MDPELIKLVAEASSAIEKRESAFPWTGADDERWSTEEQVKLLYLQRGGIQQPPRIAWCKSPAALFAAINMLKSIQAGQKHKFVDSLVPPGDPIGSAKVALLDAIIDNRLMVTMGAPLRKYIVDDPRYVWLKVWEKDFMTGLRYASIPNPFNVGSPARCDEVSIMNSDLPKVASQHALFIALYVHVCWICLPPTETVLYPNGHLAFMKFSDGYTINLKDPEAEVVDAEYLEIGETASDPLQLGDGGTDEDRN